MPVFCETELVALPPCFSTISLGGVLHFRCESATEPSVGTLIRVVVVSGFLSLRCRLLNGAGTPPLSKARSHLAQSPASCTAPVAEWEEEED